MKLTTMTQVTLDVVMQGNGAASDGRRNGFQREVGRAAGHDDTRAFTTETYQRADAFLFGRRTYEMFAGSWGASRQMRGTGTRQWRPDPLPAGQRRPGRRDALARDSAHPGPGRQAVPTGRSGPGAPLCSSRAWTRKGVATRVYRLGKRGRQHTEEATCLDHLTTLPATKGDDPLMQFPVSVIDDKTAPGSTDMRCHQRIQRATHGRALCYWVFAGGLAGTDSATVVDSRDG